MRTLGPARKKYKRRYKGSSSGRAYLQKVQEALDSVRVIGNDAVHPGTIDLNDDRDTSNQLFRLVNFIAHKMITEPREIDEIYNNLPADKLKGIQDRDAK